MNMNKENSTTSGSYRISITDNDTHKHIWGARFTKTSFFVTLVSFIVTLSAIIFCIIAFTPVKTFIPGYPDARSKRTAIQNAIKVDSLERVIYRWELYSENLKRAVSGKAPVKIDSIIKANAKTAEYAIDQASFQKQDSLLKERVKAEEQFEISARSRRELPIEGLHFFTPLKGVITQGYDAKYSSQTYTNLLADKLDAEMVDQGIGGEIFRPALIDPEMNFDPDIITVAYGTNDWSMCTMEKFEANCRGFFEVMHERYPNARVIVIAPIWRGDSERETAMARPISDVYKLFCEYTKDYDHFTVVDGWNLIPHLSAFFHDQILHPNDQGFSLYAENLYKAIKEKI